MPIRVGYPPATTIDDAWQRFTYQIEQAEIYRFKVQDPAWTIDVFAHTNWHIFMDGFMEGAIFYLSEIIRLSNIGLTDEKIYLAWMRVANMPREIKVER